MAADLNTTTVGIQTAITLYTLVMASLMLTGGKIGAKIGRRRAFSIGLVVYAAGSLTTALAPNLTVLIIGWSFLEGIGAALILPSIVALVAGNFRKERRTAAYGLIAAAGAVAVTVGPILGGAVTTYGSWRYVFVGEVVVAAVILFIGPQDRRRAAVARPGAVRPRRRVPERRRALRHRPRRPQVLDLGLRPAEARRPRRSSGSRPSSTSCAGGLLLLWLFARHERRVAAARRRAARRPRARADPPGQRGLAGLHVPVLRAGGAVLHRPGLPLDRLRAQRLRDGAPADPALGRRCCSTATLDPDGCCRRRAPG